MNDKKLEKRVAAIEIRLGKLEGWTRQGVVGAVFTPCMCGDDERIADAASRDGIVKPVACEEDIKLREREAYERGKREGIKDLDGRVEQAWNHGHETGKRDAMADEGMVRMSFAVKDGNDQIEIIEVSGFTQEQYFAVRDALSAARYTGFESGRIIERREHEGALVSVSEKCISEGREDEKERG